MTDPVAFTTATPRFGLPLLFAGQAQKEFYVNEAHSLTDVLLHCACQGETAAPPAAPSEGDTWLVAPGASGDWTGHDGKVAAFQSGTWLFVPPNDGMNVFDRSTGQILLYKNGWQRPTAPQEPTGGSAVDPEARAAISALVASLRQAGIFPSP